MLAVSERTKRDAIELYGLAEDRITVTPHGVDPAFAPGDGTHDGYLLFVGAVQARKDPLAALAAAAAAGLPLVVAGPEKEPELAAELRRRGADVRGPCPRRSSPSSTAAPRRSCCRRGMRDSASLCSRRWRAVRP